MAAQDWRLPDAIRLAKEAEQKAEDYYASAARRTVNPYGHRLLQQLASFEHQHFELLSDLEQSLAAQGAIPHYEPAPSIGPAPSEVRSAPEETPKSAMGILTMALEIEERAEERYHELAAHTENPDVGALFTRLANEEHQHYRILRNAYRSLNKYGIWNWSADEAQA